MTTPFYQDSSSIGVVDSIATTMSNHNHNNNNKNSNDSDFPNQIRPLRMEPDPMEPPFSYEEQLMQHDDHHLDYVDIDDYDYHSRMKTSKQQQQHRHSNGSHNNNNNNSHNHHHHELMHHSSSNSVDMKPTLRSVSQVNNNNSGSFSLPHNNNNNNHPSKQQQHHSTQQDRDASIPSEIVRRSASSMSMDGSTNSASKEERKRKDIERLKDRFHKHDSLTFGDYELGVIVDEVTTTSTTNPTTSRTIMIDTNQNYHHDNRNDNNDETENYDSDLDDDFDLHAIPSVVDTTKQIVSMTPSKFLAMQSYSTLDRSSSDQSTGSLLYCKTPTTGTGTNIGGGSGSGGGIGGTLSHHSGGVSGVLGSSALGKSSSLIFPTGVDSNVNIDERGKVNTKSTSFKSNQINIRIDSCEAIRFPFKKKLMLDKLNLTCADIPIKELVGTTLGNSLYKLSLAGNRLGAIPSPLVTSLPTLRTLDLSQCELHQLPSKFHLPKLTVLNLSNNRFTEFPDETIFEGLPELQELNLYGNKIAEIVVPMNPKLLSKLETLDLGYNNVTWIPDELDQLKGLKTLRIMNNLLTKVPMRICDMDLKVLDVSSNPVQEPPAETCERGICVMRRYWQCIRQEEKEKKKMLAEVQKKMNQKTKKNKVGFMGLMRSGNSSHRKSSGELSNSQTSVTTTTFSSSPKFLSQERPVSLSSLPRTESGVVKHAVSDSVVVVTSPTVAVNDAKEPQRSESNASAEDVANDGSSLISFESSNDQVSVNDTLKVIFVGMALVGKTSMIKRLIEGEDTVIPTIDERTIGVDIYDWEPKVDKRFSHIDSRIEIHDKDLREACGDVDVKLSVWDFAGQHVYHATHELFFSNRALYVLVWDMGATNQATLRKKIREKSSEKGPYKLYDSSDDEDAESDNEADLALEEEERRADRALEHDIDEKVQFWVDCIQSTCPGAVILPVASFDDAFSEEYGGAGEAQRRCRILKRRLLKHEERRIQGIESRLEELRNCGRAGDASAKRLRKLICPYTRPKLIFGDDEDSVVRVSGTKYTGFGRLTERIIGIATGKDLAGKRYPLFHGHIGARIPRMRLEVRDVVREMRGRFKVVEWGYFLNVLRDRGLKSVEDISDALHFLTNVGEVSYFGAVMQSSGNATNTRKLPLESEGAECSQVTEDANDDEVDMEDDDDGILSMDDTSITAPSTAEGTLSTIEDFMSGGLSQYVFLNPRWLVAAVACILRHDLDNEIKETRRIAAAGRKGDLTRATSFYDGHLSCPVITANDARLLWQNKRVTKKAAERAQENSHNFSVTPFDFLQKLLVRFGVFVPIDLSIDKALFGGKEYHQLEKDVEYCVPITIDTEAIEKESTAEFFFLPSLLGACEPSDTWSYKSADAWKTVICHSVLFPDGVPPGLMERLTASVLSSIYSVSNLKNDTIIDLPAQKVATFEGRLVVKEVLCWRTAFYIKLGTLNVNPDGSTKESAVEIFTHLAGKESHLCVGSDYMGVGMRRLITSARGQIGDGGRKIWKGGYLLVCKCIHRVMMEYEGLEFEKEGFCPECLSKKAVSEASSWQASAIRTAVANSEEMLRCQHGHRVDIRLVAGPTHMSEKTQEKLAAAAASGMNVAGMENAIVPVQNLLTAVVVVGLWDGTTRKVVRVGSGFIVDKKRGLIVTAAHTLINIRGEKQYPFGENYYGLRNGKVVIGIIPNDQVVDGKDIAVFRYFAQIVSKDPSFDRGECHLDACVLRITTRMENDIGGDGEGCGDQPEILLLNDQKAMKVQQLSTLKLTDKCELEEQVRIVGYNQGGEGLLGPGESLNRYVDFAKGYVCMKFVHDHEQSPPGKRTELFKPREEIVVICPTIGGHSGGPCVNQQGEVIGILSRADPAENQRCYLVPASEIKLLVNRAKKLM